MSLVAPSVRSLDSRAAPGGTLFLKGRISSVFDTSVMDGSPGRRLEKVCHKMVLWALSGAASLFMVCRVFSGVFIK